MIQGQTYTVSVTVKAVESDLRLLAPTGLSSPHGECNRFNVAGGEAETVIEDGSGQQVALIKPNAPIITIEYGFEPHSRAYPETIFTPLTSRYTAAAEALIEEARAIAPELSRKARQRAIAAATAERFTYGHAERRFNEGYDEVPALGCGVVEGSCVDINTYFLASLRAAGFQAGYVVGPFFPAEKIAEDGSGWCNDMHCWVISRDGDDILEWDIAHHLKIGTREIAPSPNPKPGLRFAVGHSMGLNFPALGIVDLKLLSDPVWVDDTGRIVPSSAEISCTPM